MIIWPYTGFASRCITLAQAYALLKQYNEKRMRGGALSGETYNLVDASPCM